MSIEDIADIGNESDISPDLGMADASSISYGAKHKQNHSSQQPKFLPSEKFIKIKGEYHPTPYHLTFQQKPVSFHEGCEDSNEALASVISNLDIPTPQEGSIYPDFEALRYAVDAWALREKFLTRIYKKDSARAIYVCRQASHGCEWRIRANMSHEPSSVVLVSIVQPRHTCNTETRLSDRNIGSSDVKTKYAKRGAQFTQRWVRDALAHCGFFVSLETDPIAIVRCIEERFGETISRKLATKAKNSLLVARGELSLRRAGRTGRPSRAETEERKRDIQQAMTLQREEKRAERPFLDGTGAYCVDTNSTGACGRSFVFENSSVRISTPPIDVNHQPGLKVETTPDYAIDPRLGGSITANVPTAVVASAADHAFTSYPTPTPSDSACGGNDLFRLRPADSVVDTDALTGFAADTPDSLADIEQEIILLEKQMEILQKRIEALKRQRQRRMSEALH